MTLNLAGISMGPPARLAGRFSAENVDSSEPKLFVGIEGL